MRTFRPKTKISKSSRFKNRGFTLIEVLIVITLIALLATAVIPRLTSVFRAGVQSSVRRYTALVRYAYDQAVLTGRLHRIVLDLDKQAWRVEAADAGDLPTSQKTIEDHAHDRDQGKSFEPNFKKMGQNFIEAMPNGVELVQVESWRLGKKPITKGVVSIYAYPSGFVDEATVTLSEQGRKLVQRFTVKTMSLTGAVKVETETMP